MQSTYTDFGVLFFRQYSVFKDPVVLSHVFAALPRLPAHAFAWACPRFRTALKSSGERLHFHEGLLPGFSACPPPGGLVVVGGPG